MTSDEHAGRNAGQRPYGTVLATLIVTDVAYSFQQSAIIPAIPTVARALRATEAWSAWLLSAYLMIATVATPAIGRYADLHGRKRMLVTALVVFLIGSVGAALSPDMATLIVFRAVQGVGGAVFPLAFAVVRDVLPRERVPAAIGALTGAFGAGTALGFGLGGLLAQAASWRLIFAVGAVLVGIGTALVGGFVPRSGGAAHGRFDLLGTVLIGGAAVGVLLALTVGVQAGWRAPGTIALFVGSAVVAVSWVRVELRISDPLIDLRIFRARPVLFANFATIGLGWALFGAYFLVPQLLRAASGGARGFATSATATGLYLLPAAAGQLVAGPAAGRLAARFSAARVFAVGLGVVTLALVLLGTEGETRAGVLTGTLLLGVGAGLAIQTSSSVVTQGVAADQTSTSTALNSTIRRFAGGIGGQVSAILLAALAVATGAAPSPAAFTVAFLTAAGLALLGGVLALLMPDTRSSC